ncbi:hypothetical protein TWF730_009144 [Orbilia blumenaviensis]|uniref:Uncharacterized protein n=1 Tax=Orbilia blumenaviensis TaxID=1796055 RepID=A0AAV9V0P5_9PEZI
MLRVWGQPPVGLSTSVSVEAERGKATPHIKTYNCFSPPRADNEGCEYTKDYDDENEIGAPTIVPMDWAMITSANLSKQAWGNPARGSGHSATSKIQSYEVGVLVHPGLWKDLLKGDTGSVTMSAVGGKDWLAGGGTRVRDTDVSESMDGKCGTIKIGIRLAYDYPLKPYTNSDEPWCKDTSYTVRDWKGITWPPKWEERLRAAMGIFPSEEEDEE